MENGVKWEHLICSICAQIQTLNGKKNTEKLASVFLFQDFLCSSCHLMPVCAHIEQMDSFLLCFFVDCKIFCDMLFWNSSFLKYLSRGQCLLVSPETSTENTWWDVPPLLSGTNLCCFKNSLNRAVQAYWGDDSRGTVNQDKHCWCSDTERISSTS